MRFSSTLLCLIFALAMPAAAQTEITSAIESVTVYPDGATVTRRIRVDLPQGDSVLRAVDFPPMLDPASLRIEGEARTRLTIGGIDARPPRAERPPTDPALDDRIEALRDDRARLDGKIAATAADATIRDARIMQRNIDREVARLDARRTANPPRKMEVRIDINSEAPTSVFEVSGR